MNEYGGGQIMIARLIHIAATLLACILTAMSLTSAGYSLLSGAGLIVLIITLSVWALGRLIRKDLLMKVK